MTSMPDPPADADSVGHRRPRPYDDALVAAIASGESQASAARHLGISDRTIRRRLRDPEIQTRISVARRDRLAEAMGRAAAISVQAVNAIEHILLSGPPVHQLRAAQLLLEFTRQTVTDDEYRARIQRLEEADDET